jgi:hypothetical protein
MSTEINGSQNVYSESFKTQAKLLSKPINKPALEHEDLDDSFNSSPNNQAQELWHELKQTYAEFPTSFDGAKKDNKLAGMSFMDRLGHYKNKRKENTISLALEKLAGEQAQCTFTPRINSSSRRSLKDFLKEQESFLENKTQKIKNIQLDLIEKELKALKQTPHIDPMSELICSLKPRRDSLTKITKKQPIEEKKVTKRPRSRQNISTRLFEGKRSSMNQIKKIREEKQAMEQKKEEELNRSLRKIKETHYVQKRLTKELNNIFNKHNTSPILFNAFCNLAFNFHR